MAIRREPIYGQRSWPWVQNIEMSRFPRLQPSGRLSNSPRVPAARDTSTVKQQTGDQCTHRGTCFGIPICDRVTLSDQLHGGWTARAFHHHSAVLLSHRPVSLREIFGLSTAIHILEIQPRQHTATRIGTGSGSAGMHEWVSYRRNRSDNRMDTGSLTFSVPLHTQLQ